MANAPVETKVKASTGTALLVGITIAFLNWTEGDSQLLGSLPAWGQALASIVIPPVLVFLSGWKASHSPRPVTGVYTPED